MKNKIAICIVLLSTLTLAKAQTDYCKDINKKLNGAGDVTYYESPISFLSIDKSIWTGHDGTTTLTFSTTKKDADYDAYGIFVTFTDGSVWTNEGSRIDCSYANSTIGYRYIYVEILDQDLIQLFKIKKITKVQIKDVIIPVDDAFATKFMAYVNCIDAIKK